MDNKCIRCGLCCTTAPCNYGIETDYGSCEYLSFDNNIAICGLLKKGKIEPENIGIGKGCNYAREPKLKRSIIRLYGGRLKFLKGEVTERWHVLIRPQNQIELKTLQEEKVSKKAQS